MTASSPEPLLIDGATGTELNRRGVETSLPLWSARALLDFTGTATLRSIHVDYLRAGAGAITANTFRTHRRNLEQAGMGDRARDVTGRAVQIAREACTSIDADAFVLGSVAPLEDCYSPERAPDEVTCRREHGEFIEHLIDAGVDYLLIETMNTVREARAAMQVARYYAPGRWMVSCCLRDDGPPGVLLSGESIAELRPELSSGFAVGVNCVAAPSVGRQVEFLRAELPDAVRIIAYANVGRPDDVQGWVNTDAVEPERYAAYAMQWINAGASIVGGCCGTTPETIAAIAEALRVN